MIQPQLPLLGAWLGSQPTARGRAHTLLHTGGAALPSSAPAAAAGSGAAGALGEPPAPVASTSTLASLVSLVARLAGAVLARVITSSSSAAAAGDAVRQGSVKLEGLGDAGRGLQVLASMTVQA